MKLKTLKPIKQSSNKAPVPVPVPTPRFIVSAKPVPPLVCQPLRYDKFPWAKLLPHEDAEDSFNLFNSPAIGVNFNINLGGYAPSWQSEDPNEVYVILTDVDATGDFKADGPVYEQGNRLVDLNRRAASFPVRDGALLRYRAVGGNGQGLNNPPPGKTSYEGVASAPSWYASSLISPKFMGMPVIFEMWYSLNPRRLERLGGFNNYTLFGNQEKLLPEFNVRKGLPGIFITKYHAGIFKTHTDMGNIKDKDCVLAVFYDGDNTGGIARMVVNGVETGRRQTLRQIDTIYTELDFFTEYPADQVVGFTGGVYNFVFHFEDDGNSGPDWEIDSGATRASIESQIKIDTRDIKVSWIVDAETGLPQGVWDPDTNLYCQPRAMYTLPNVPLPCDPHIVDYVPPPPLRSLVLPVAPLPDFAISVIEGPLPLTVDFTDLSTMNPTGWYWTFGDGWDSNAQNPTHVYEGLGTYTVSLTASNVYGAAQEVRPFVIRVTPN